MNQPLLSCATVTLLFLTAFTTGGCEPRPEEPENRKHEVASSPEHPAQNSTAPQGNAALHEAAAHQGAGLPGPGGSGAAESFSLSQALEGLPGEGKLFAEIQTELGSLKCELFPEKAPLTVANFVGLARGLRSFHDGKSFTKRPAYDGTSFHRVIADFMIQGGDPTGTGGGTPGYTIPDEIWQGARHDRKGQLCMANRGKNTNGMQFFITDGPAPHLDGGYTIFGQCSPVELVSKLARVKTQGERPLSPPRIQKLRISREKK